MARPTVLPLPKVSDPDVALRGAEIEKAFAGNTIEQLVLFSDSKVGGRLSNAQLDVTQMLIGANLDLTLVGASTVTVHLLDPEWQTERSGILDLNEDRRLDDIDIFINDLGFRLQKATRQDPTILELVFEDLAVSWLRLTTKKRVWSRGSVTRAQAIAAMVDETNRIYASPPVGYFSPEQLDKQPVQSVKLPSVAPSGTGWKKGTSFQIKGVAADAAQKRNVAIVMEVCDRLAVSEKVRRAAIVTAIGESSFQSVRNTTGSDYGGVFQGRVVANATGPKWFNLDDTEKEAYYFLKGGKGYQSGGAIALLKAQPSIPEGQVSWMVGGDRSNFGSDQAATHFYQQWISEARHIATLWKTKGGGKTSADTLFKVKQYTFTRGLPGKRESSWDAAQRLAAEVNWRFFVAGGVAAFVTDDWLIAQSPALKIAGDGGVLIEPPSYDYDHGKIANTVTLRVAADRWSTRPGGVVVFDAPRWGPINGRWLILEVQQNLFDATDCTVTLTKPLAPRPEPAPEVTTFSKKEQNAQNAGKTAGAHAAIAWAQSKVGHFKETGWNTGPELNKLEGAFNMRSEPWCAIFATTAVSKGVGDQVKTAAVSTIRSWALAGTNGYLKGYRNHNPQPGDLLCIGVYPHDHVAFVERIDGSTLHTIEGNTSAGKVSRGTRSLAEGDIARPDYRGGS